MKTKIQSVDQYIETFPDDIQKILQKIRAVIKKAAPESEEGISYNMPAYKQNGILVYFAAHKNHIGFYPTPAGISEFEEELKGYESAKGSVKFLLNEDIPYELISSITKFKVSENASKKK